MVLDVKKITPAYRCKSCGSTVFGISGAVALSGDLIKLKCKCGESELSLKSTNDGKFRVTIPCVFFYNDHQFLISKISLKIG
ncbi:MAG: hypothetical protein MJ236_03425 [Clostridia bacterium]|nr:hypothetical protein [Clostridia bacterium]